MFRGAGSRRGDRRVRSQALWPDYPEYVQIKLAGHFQIDHIKSHSSDHIINLCLMPKFVNQSFGATSKMELKWIWTTRWGFDRADLLVYELAKRDLAVLLA